MVGRATVGRGDVCGPRYTIIQDIPYDRPQTSMKSFAMGPDCLKEYKNPLNRRFHAQPNACPVCGPQLFLLDNKGKRVDGNNPAQALALAAQFLRQGKIVAIKGLGGVTWLWMPPMQRRLICCAKEKRPHKPFALMAAWDYPCLNMFTWMGMKKSGFSPITGPSYC